MSVLQCRRKWSLLWLLARSCFIQNLRQENVTFSSVQCSSKHWPRKLAFSGFTSLLSVLIFNVWVQPWSVPFFYFRKLVPRNDRSSTDATRGQRRSRLSIGRRKIRWRQTPTHLRGSCSSCRKSLNEKKRKEVTESFTKTNTIICSISKIGEWKNKVWRWCKKASFGGIF